MKKLICCIVALVCLMTVCNAQTFTKAAANAFLITRMADKFHVQPKPLNDTFSVALFNLLVSRLDDEKIFFTLEDINALAPYKLQLDDDIRQHKTTFLQLLSGIYSHRLQQADSMAAAIGKQPFDFSVNENYTVTEDTSYPASIPAMRSKIYKLLKASVLNAVADSKKLYLLSVVQQKKYVDSIEPVLRYKAASGLHRNIITVLQSPGGLQQYISDEYCEAIALCYDPHSAFFPANEKENFEGGLGANKPVFGFGLKNDEDEDGVTINDLLPGSPAFKSGQLNVGDKILSVQWAGQQPVDVSNASPEEVARILSESNHDKLVLKVKKADASMRDVTLVKELMEADDENTERVKSFLLKGNKTIGYISLPAFYTDWEGNSNVKGCANDVAKEIIKLKKENISGLILDIRYNGGGSVQEAVELAGIFIDAGPVAQEKYRNAKLVTLKDINRGTIYDGPLAVMINGYSASASELLAGTLQDYNRAVIIGSASYGKATAQAVLPLDTTINENSDAKNIHTDSYIKLTMSQLFRVSGKTAQATGVIPDVTLPDFTDADPDREVNNLYALRPAGIEANAYYHPLKAFPVAALQQTAISDVQASSYFNRLKAYITEEKEAQQKEDKSLRLQDVLHQPEEEEAVTLAGDTTAAGKFTIENNFFEKERALSDSRFADINKEFIRFLQKDAYLKIAYDVISLLP